jgi:hypothetical protein
MEEGMAAITSDAMAALSKSLSDDNTKRAAALNVALEEENTRGLALHVATLVEENNRHAVALKASNLEALAKIEGMMNAKMEGVVRMLTESFASLKPTVGCVGSVKLTAGSAPRANVGSLGAATPAHAPHRRTSIVTKHAPTAAEIRELHVGRRQDEGELSLLPPSDNSGIAVVLVYTQLHSISPAEVRVYGDQACTFAGGGRRISLERLIGQHHHITTSESYEETLALVSGNMERLFTRDQELYELVHALPVPYPQHWATPGHTGRPAELLIVRVHGLPLSHVRAYESDPREFETLASGMLQTYIEWAAPTTIIPSDSVNASTLSGSLNEYRPYRGSPEELVVANALWGLLHTNVTPTPVGRRGMGSSGGGDFTPTGDMAIDSRMRSGKFPDIKKFLYYQLMDLPGNPVKDWPQKVSCQLWHLTIIGYFASGAVGISFPLMREFGASALISNIVTLVIDRSAVRFDRLRGIYEAFKPQVELMIKDAIHSVKEIEEGGGTHAEVQKTLVLSLCNILLALRAEPYTRDVDRMSRLEIRRLLIVKKPVGMSDGAWIVEMTSRLRNWRTLHGELASMKLQDELRDLLHNIAEQLSSGVAITRFVDIVNELMEGMAKSNFGGDMAKLPGLAQVAGRSVRLPESVEFSTRLIDKIVDLHLVHQVGVHQKNGDAGALLESVLRHVSQRWDPEELSQSLLGQDGPDVMLLIRTVPAGMDEAGRAMRQSTSTRVTMDDDVLASPDPFPSIEHSSGQASGGNRLDNQFALMDQNTNATREHTLLAVTDKTVVPAREQSKNLEVEMQNIKNYVTESHAEMRKFINSQSAELSHLALLSRTTAENTASPEMKHGTTIRPATGTIMAAIAADATRGLTAPAPVRRDVPRRGAPTSTRFGDALKKRNLGTKPGDRNGETRGSRPPRFNPDGTIKMRLLDKPPTLFNDLTNDAKVVLSTRIGVGTEADFIEMGGQPCQLCKPADHHLHHCVKIWAATEAGQKWLGTTKAAELRAKLGNEGLVFSMHELVANSEQYYLRRNDVERDSMVDATLFICHYCGIDADPEDTSDDAAELLMFVAANHGADMDTVLTVE